MSIPKTDIMYQCVKAANILTLNAISEIQPSTGAWNAMDKLAKKTLTIVPIGEW